MSNVTGISLLIALAIIVQSLIEITVELMNVRFMRTRGALIPEELKGVTDREAHRKAVEYAISRGRFNIVSHSFTSVVTLSLLLSGFYGYIDQLVRVMVPWSGDGKASLYVSGVSFAIASQLLPSVLSLPFSYYSTFRIEAIFGFNKTTIKQWVSDLVLSSIVGGFLMALLLCALLFVMQACGSAWWLVATAVVLVFLVFVQLMFPTVIAPLFNKFEPLKDTELASGINAMCNRLSFPISGVYQIDGSKRSTKANAFIAGFWRAKRIALFDTLLASLSHDEVLSVLAHEIGHNKRRHALKSMLLSIPFIVSVFLGMELVREYVPFYEAFSIAQASDYALLVIFQIAAGPLLFFFGPLTTWISRKHEYEADRFAADALQSPAPLIGALVSLSKSNATSPAVHWLYAVFHDSHPRLPERISALGRVEA